jgi:glycosyltransferase involved in cell wall biosynthesis
MSSALSSYVLTHNSERYLARVLAQLNRVADEVIVLDSGSTDNTVAIARASGCRVEMRPFANFSDQRNWAQSLCSHDYLLYIDSDEIMSDALVDALLVMKKRGFTCESYRIRRETFAFGRAIHAIYPAISPDYQIRLYRRSLGSFESGYHVHERLQGVHECEAIDAPMEHHTVADFAELERKLRLYTDLASEDVAARGSSPWVLWSLAWTRWPFAFAKWYISRGGWKDGRVGLTLGRFALRYTHLKYLKASRLVRMQRSVVRAARVGAQISPTRRDI